MTQYAIRERKQDVTAKGSPYLRLTLGSRQGDVKAVYWDVPADVATACQVGTVIEPEGQLSEYQGEPQLKITSLRVVPAVKIRYEDLLPVSPHDRSFQRQKLRSYIDGLENEDLRRLLNVPFSMPALVEQYVSWPAAVQYHHSWIGGLLDHSLEVADIAGQMAVNWRAVTDRDLLITGALLHDVGKLREIAVGTTFEFTTRGRLLGHTALGFEAVTAFQDEANIPEPLCQELLHMIASHHGQLEWGAVAVPKTANAVALHLADLASSRMAAVSQAVTNHTGDDPWTAYDRMTKSQYWIPVGPKEAATA